MSRIALRIVLAAGLAAAAAAAPAAAEVSSDVRTLPHRRAVLLPDGQAGGWFAVAEDSGLAAMSGPEFTDLRLVGADGRSRTLHAEPPARSRVVYTRLRELPVVWAEAADGMREMTVTLEEAEAGQPLTVEVTGLSAGPAFQVTGRDDPGDEWVYLPISPDGAQGMRPPDKHPVARVDLGETRRFLRLQQHGSGPPGADDRVRLLARDVIGAAMFPVQVRSATGRFHGSSRNEWIAEIVLEGPARAVTRMDLRWAERQPGHGTRLQAKLPAGGWTEVYTETEPPEGGTETSLKFEPVRTTALRLTVYGADAPNEPCMVDAVRAVPLRWLFRADAAESLWVAFGDPYQKVAAAVAEGPDSPQEVREAALGPVEPSPWYREPGFGLEWLKRRPAVLGAVMVVLLGAVAWLALVRRSPD